MNPPATITSLVREDSPYLLLNLQHVSCFQVNTTLFCQILPSFALHDAPFAIIDNVPRQLDGVLMSKMPVLL